LGGSVTSPLPSPPLLPPERSAETPCRPSGWRRQRRGGGGASSTTHDGSGATERRELSPPTMVAAAARGPRSDSLATGSGRPLAGSMVSRRGAATDMGGCGGQHQGGGAVASRPRRARGRVAAVRRRSPRVCVAITWALGGAVQRRGARHLPRRGAIVARSPPTLARAARRRGDVCPCVFGWRRGCATVELPWRACVMGWKATACCSSGLRLRRRPCQGSVCTCGGGGRRLACWAARCGRATSVVRGGDKGVVLRQQDALFGSGGVIRAWWSWWCCRNSAPCVYMRGSCSGRKPMAAASQDLALPVGGVI
jgi:hypothetical protein